MSPITNQNQLPAHQYPRAWEEARDRKRAAMRARPLRVRLASAFKPSQKVNYRELVMGPSRPAVELAATPAGKETDRLECSLRSQMEPPCVEGAGLSMMLAPAGCIAMPRGRTSPDLRPIEWMFIKTRKTVRFAEGDDLEHVLIIPAREDEDDSFPEDISEYYTCSDDADEVDEEEARACDFDRLVGFAADAVRRRRGAGAERLWAAAQY